MQHMARIPELWEKYPFCVLKWTFCKQTADWLKKQSIFASKLQKAFKKRSEIHTKGVERDLRALRNKV